jgi:nicotinamide-nucleotide amidase
MQQINATLVTIGDELLIGQTIDTNSAWMARQLNLLGIWVRARVAIGDEPDAILETLAYESRQSDLILITGGLGPTADDRTKEALCRYFDTRLVENAEVLSRLKTLFATRGLPVLERNLRQAWLPETCRVMANNQGTAPGMWFEKEDVIYVSMPGVPHEMEGIMQQEVLPALAQRFTLPVILHRTLVTMGLGESSVAERLVGFEEGLPSHLQLAYLPGNGLLKLRLTARGELPQKAAAEMEQYFGLLKEILHDIMVADEDVPLEAWVGKLLAEAGLTVSTAESCTGGLVAHKLTSVPRASAYFRGAAITYANDRKTSVLGVSGQVLAEKGAVSEQTVVQMVQGVLHLMETDLAVAVSGIMGPDGGSPEKPVGTVWIAAGSATSIVTRKYQLRYGRARNTEITANYALNLLRQCILDVTEAAPAG